MFIHKGASAMVTRRWTRVVLGLGFLGIIGIEGPQDGFAQNPRRTAIVEAVEKCRPSIVTIKVPSPNGGKDHIGSGIIIDARGYIVTNRHVIAGRKSVKI